MRDVTISGKRAVVLRSPGASSALWGVEGIVYGFDDENNVRFAFEGEKQIIYVIIPPSCVLYVQEADSEIPADTVREDPPVAVPGYVTVTVREDQFVMCSDRPDEGEKPPRRKMILTSSVESVGELDDGSVLIRLKWTNLNDPLIPPLHVVEDFDEVSRRMRTAMLGEEFIV
jgi:hypothetical protein